MSYANLAGLFKKIYSKKGVTLLPNPKYAFLRDAQFETRERMGASYEQPVELTNEVSVDVAVDGETITFSDASTSVVKTASLTPVEIFVHTSLNSATISRSQSDEGAFEKATQGRVKANLKSHWKFLSHVAIYGKNASGLGALSAISVGGKSVTLTAADWSGFFIGMEGLKCEQVSDTVRTDLGAIVSINPETRVIVFANAPIALSAGDHLEIKQLPVSKQFLGAKGILSTSGTLFGISTGYSIWKGVEVAMGAKKLTFKALIDVLAKLAGKGLEDDCVCYVSSPAWSNLMTEQAALRDYDSSYTPNETVSGSEGIKFHFHTGKVTVKVDNCLRASDAFIIPEGSARRIGSSDADLRLPGYDDQNAMVSPMTTTNALIFRSRSDQALMLDKPGLSAWISGIDPASAT